MCSLRYLSLLHLFDRNTDLPQAVTCPAGLRIRSLKHTENIKDTAVFVEVVFNVGISGVHADDSSWEEAWSTEKKNVISISFYTGLFKKANSSLLGMGITLTSVTRLPTLQAEETKACINQIICSRQKFNEHQIPCFNSILTSEPVLLGLLYQISA